MIDDEAAPLAGDEPRLAEMERHAVTDRMSTGGAQRGGVAP
jgi:hypothetical protein